MPTTMRLDYIILQIHEEKNPKDVSVVFHVHKEFITESFWFFLQQFSRSQAPLIWVAWDWILLIAWECPYLGTTTTSSVMKLWHSIYSKTVTLSSVSLFAEIYVI